MTSPRTLALFLVLLAFWLLLSGQYNPLFIGMGVASAALVTALTHDMVERELGDRPSTVRAVALKTWWFAVYTVWLFGRILPAGVQVAWFVVHPRMPIDPHMLRFRTQLSSPIARTILANSITLVPGTMSVTVEGDEFCVHTMVPASAADLISARMQNHVGRVFLEPPQQPPEIVWEPVLKETRP